jgi:PAS domain S-box-containing protein
MKEIFRKQTIPRVETTELLHARYSSMLSNISEVISIVGPDRIVTYTSPNVERHFGWSQESVIGKSCISNVHPEDMDYVRKVMDSMVEDENLRKTLVFRYRCKDGSYKPIELRVVNMMNDPIINGVLMNYHDISEHKKVENELRESENRFKNLANHSRIITWECDTNGIYTYISDVSYAVLGYLPEEIINLKRFYDWHPEEGREDFKKAAFETFSRKESFRDMENQIVAKDGHLVWVSTNGMPVLDAEGNLKGYRGTDTDITQRKRGEEERANQLSLFNALLDSIPDAIFFKDTKGVYLGCNPAFAKMLEHTKDEIIGKTDYDYFDKEIADSFSQTDLETMHKRHPTYTEDWFTYPDGRKVFHKTQKTPYLASNGSLIGIIGIIHDISNLKNSEILANESSQKWETIVSGSPDGIAMVSLDGRLEFVSDRFALILGFPPEEKNQNLGRSVIDFIHPSDHQQIANNLGQLSSGGKGNIISEYTAIRRDLSHFNLEINSVILHDQERKPEKILVIGRDITDRKIHEKALIETNQSLKLAMENAREMAIKAETASKSKSVFLSNMSHEIRTPLNAIIGLSQLLIREKLTPKQSNYVNSLYRSGENLLSLLNDILELSKIEAGRLAVSQVNADMFSLISDLKLVFQEKVQLKKLRLVFETFGNFPQYISVDAGKLRQIFINLIGNAVKFTEKGEIAVRMRIELTKGRKSRLVVDIQDTGCGIAADEIDQLFKRFEQASAGIKLTTGTGLGLALTREIVLFLGGNISVVSELGKGSVFSFYIEIEEVTAVLPEEKNNKHILSISTPRNAYRVLVVDDAIINLELATALLNLAGFETKQAQNGEEAITLFEEWNPHIILMDLRMPVMNGYEATRRIKSTEKGKQTPILIITASLFEDEMSDSVASDIEGYILKPFQEKDFFGAIGKALGIRFIYEEENLISPSGYMNNQESIEKDMSSLPDDIVGQLLEALDAADFYRLKGLIEKIEPGHEELVNHLLAKADNFDSDYLQQILNRKKSKNE